MASKISQQEEIHPMRLLRTERHAVRALSTWVWEKVPLAPELAFFREPAEQRGDMREVGTDEGIRRRTWGCSRIHFST